jgi:hypothetical protein
MTTSPLGEVLRFDGPGMKGKGDVTVSFFLLKSISQTVSVFLGF